MPTIDKRVDDYIANAADFAQPLLEHWRTTVHAALPHCVETLKWGAPHFEQDGQICGMAAFKAHCAFSFHKAALLDDPKGLLNAEAGGGWGALGKVAKKSDLPSVAQLKKWMKQAAKLNADGVKTPKAKKKPIKVEIPEMLAAAFEHKKHAKARKAFEAMAPSHQREYCDWIAEAKRDATKEKRLATTLEWLAEGKKRNWKYENC